MAAVAGAPEKFLWIHFLCRLSKNFVFRFSSKSAQSLECASGSDSFLGCRRVLAGGFHNDVSKFLADNCESALVYVSFDADGY